MDIDIDKLEAAARDFQSRVQPWMMTCFGPIIAGDREERNHRFLEEALELVQACGCTSSEAHQLVDYVYGRDIGEKVQEVGGVMVTLAALCLANSMDMHTAGETELARIWTKVDVIRAKQAAKPKHSPLPVAIPEIQRKEESQSFWVVEQFKDGHGGKYWDGGNSRSFTEDINEAIHFCRRSDVIWSTRGWHWEDTKITEHIMLTAAASQQLWD